MNAENFDIITPAIRLFWKAQGYHTFKIMDWHGIKKNNDGWLGTRPDSRWIKDAMGEYKIKPRMVMVHGDYLVFHVRREQAKWAEYIFCSAGLSSLFGVPLLDEKNRKAGENRAVKGMPRSWAMQERDRRDNHIPYFPIWGHLYRLLSRSHTLTGWVNMAEYTNREFNEQTVVPSRTRYRTESLPTERLSDEEHFSRVMGHLKGGGDGYRPFLDGDERDISPRKFREKHHASSIVRGKLTKVQLNPTAKGKTKPKPKPVATPSKTASLLTRIKNG